MSRFDIFVNPGKKRRNIPYLVDVQSKANIASARAYQFAIQGALDRLFGAY